VRYNAKVINTDKEKNITILKIDANNLKAAVLGDSNQLKVGSAVTYIGNPGGKKYMGTVTQGVVSGLNRNVYGSNNESGLIQIDRQINHGDTGSGLVNQKGEIVGINTEIRDNQDYGFGFAIPINDAKDIIDRVLNKDNSGSDSNKNISNEDSRPFIGITVTPNENSQGLFVKVVVGSSSAEKSGIKEGDTILKFNNKEMNTYSDLETFKDTCKMGDAIKVELLRNNRKEHLTLKLTEYKNY